jgi:tRNA pseudouridine32 synthase/23S rRNA pseudouridine746 synthase
LPEAFHIVAPMQQPWQGRIMWENRVLFLDGEALVIDKPAGLAVHPGSRTPRSLEDHLHQLRFGFERLPQPVHRLDRDTSGCLLLARNPKAHRRFQRAFEEKRVTKLYVAIVEGVPPAPAGTIDMPLGKVSTARDGWRMVPDDAGKAAVTHWQVAAVVGGRALIAFRPDTGLTHQNRVHAASGLGLPIAGDPRYGGGAGPMLLHARALGLEREGKAAIAAVAPLPAAFHDAGFDDAGFDDAAL